MPPTTLNMDITVLPPDVLSLYDESFYELVRKLAGPIEADLLELQAIRSAYSLIHTEDIFDILNNNITLASQPSAQILPTSSPLSSTTVTGTKGAVPSITSIDGSITKAGGKIIEDEFRYDALRDLQTSNNYQLAVCSEDCTGVIQKVELTELQENLTLLMFFVVGCESLNGLEFRIFEFLPFQRTAIRNMYALCVSLQVFFAKLPDMPISERNDVLEVKLPNNWSSWFFMRTCQLFFFQDPVHICTKIRNRLLSQSASMFIGNRKISVDVLFDLINNQSKLIHGLVKTDVYPKDRQNFASCAKISTDGVLSALNNVSDSYATQIYLGLLRSIIIAHIEKSTSIIDRIYHSWMTVFICRLWWAWLQLTDVEEISTEHQDKNKAFFFITKAAYHSIEINAHTLLSVVLLVCQHDMSQSAQSISSFNSQACENIFRLTRSMSGTFSPNVNFTVGQFLRRAGKLSVLQDIDRQNEHNLSECSLQFPKHHKRRHRKDMSINNRLDVSNNILTQNTIEKTIHRAFDDAYKMLSVLCIDVILVREYLNALDELSTYVRVQIENTSHTTDFSENWNGYSDDELDSKDDVHDQYDVISESSSEDEADEQTNNSGHKRSQFKGLRIFNEIPAAQSNSYFRINVDENEKYMHTQTASWLLTDNRPALSANQLQRVQQRIR
ncbi:unnamed protein product [Rotaria socialis]|uniref:Uncharacterized protein n=2 Tax=Rotaria socialis TaxID=392032 RepID=A0A821EG24_9BILA|nr:unnamed protein product [Rotaria socialis]